jgi:DNA-binding protein YbaB
MTPEQADDAVSRTSRLAERLAGITGRGKAADGHVAATWSHAAGLAGLTIDPGARQLGPAELAEHVRVAVNAARADFAAQVRAASTEIAGAAGLDADTLARDPAAALARVEHLGTGLADRLRTLARDLTAQQRRAQQAAGRLTGD